MVIPASSTEFVHIPAALPAGVDSADTPARIAIVAHRADPADDEWRDAEWSGADVRLLVGPDSSLVLAAGDYRVWINLDPPGVENVVRKAGLLTII